MFLSVLSQKRAVFEGFEKLPKASSPTSGAIPVIVAVRYYLFPFVQTLCRNAGAFVGEHRFNSRRAKLYSKKQHAKNGLTRFKRITNGKENISRKLLKSSLINDKILLEI